MDTNTSKQTESRYNMNESNFVLLGELQREAYTFMNVKKDYNSCMDRWMSIRSIIESVFSDTELESLDDIEQEFSKSLRFNVPEGFNTSKSFYGLSERQKYINKVYQTHRLKHLRSYIRNLSIFMRKYKISMTDLDKKKGLT